MMLITIRYIDPHCICTTTPTGTGCGNSLLVTTSPLANIYSYSFSIVNTQSDTVYLCQSFSSKDPFKHRTLESRWPNLGVVLCMSCHLTGCLCFPPPPPCWLPPPPYIHCSSYWAFLTRNCWSRWPKAIPTPSTWATATLSLSRTSRRQQRS